MARVRNEIVEEMNYDDDYKEDVEEDAASGPKSGEVPTAGTDNPLTGVTAPHTLAVATVPEAPVIDLTTGNYLRPVPVTDWIWRHNSCNDYAIFAERFPTHGERTDEDARQARAGLSSLFQGFGAPGYEDRPNVLVDCPAEGVFNFDQNILEGFFPNFNFSGLHNLPSEFLVKHGSTPLGSRILPTSFPLTFPRFPLPDDTTHSGVRRGTMADSVRESLVYRNVDPMAFGPTGVYQPITNLIFKAHNPRPLPIGNAGGGWSVSRRMVGIGNNSWELKVVLPPFKPTVCIVGASHVDRMSKLDLSLFDEHDDMPDNDTHPHYLLWSSTAFVIVKGDSYSFNQVKSEIFAFFFDRIKHKFVGRIHPNDHLRFVLLPFSWDILYVPIEGQVWNLIKMSKFLTELRFSTDYVQISHVFTEIPLLHTEQDYCIRSNVCVREVNNLINPNHAPIRIWNLRMVPNNSDMAFKKVTVAGIRGMSLVKEFDRNHLNQSGYFAWCMEIWDRAILETVPTQQEAWRDFDPMNLLVVPNLGLGQFYFEELVKADSSARKDRTDIDAAARLSFLQSIRVDMRLLNNSYGQRAPRIRNQRQN